MSSKAASALHEVRHTCSIALAGLRATPRARRWWRDLVAQSRALAGVTVVPVVVVSLAFGALAALQVGGFARELAAGSGTAAGVVLAAVGWAAPAATALLLAGACGSVMTAAPAPPALDPEPTADAPMPDRAVSDRPDRAMPDSAVSEGEVHGLVAARLWAAAVMGVLLVCLASLAGATGGFLVEVVLHDVDAGTYLEAARRSLDLAAATSSVSVGFASGILAATIASSAGLHVATGPRGVGDAVHRSVVVTVVVTVVLVLVAFLGLTLLRSALSAEQLLLVHRPLTLAGS